MQPGEWDEVPAEMFEDPYVSKSTTEAPTSSSTPIWAWFMLILSVLAVSSAGAAFKTFEGEVSPVLIASWRLQVTSYAMLPFCVGQFLGMHLEDRYRIFSTECSHPRASLLLKAALCLACPAALMCAAGASLALHFGAWVWGLNHTSIPHSLFFVSTTPVLIAGGMLLLGLPVSRSEIAGTALAAAGGAVLAFMGAQGAREEVTLAGDAASLLGSFAMIGYLSIGSNLRQWMPVFVYIVPVTYLASVFMAMYAMCFEGATLMFDANDPSTGVVGYFSGRFAPRVVYLALVPGVMGHFNIVMLLRYISPLVITLAFSMEPVVGSGIGWVFGLSAPPSVWTCTGGLLMLLGCVAVSIASAKRKEVEMKSAIRNIKSCVRYEQLDNDFAFCSEDEFSQTSSSWAKSPPRDRGHQEMVQLARSSSPVAGAADNQALPDEEMEQATPAQCLTTPYVPRGALAADIDAILLANPSPVLPTEASD